MALTNVWMITFSQKSHRCKCEFDPRETVLPCNLRYGSAQQNTGIAAEADDQLI